MSERPLVAVMDYGIGNLRSVQKAFEFAGADARLTADSALLERSSAIVLPGVGEFGSCVSALEAAGLTAVAKDAALEATEGGRPFLGICVGMQMLFEDSEESPRHPGLGVLPGRVRRLPEGVRRPQMQWNRLSLVGGDEPVAPDDALLEGAWMYFVHSFAAELTSATLAVCDYGGPTTAAVRSGELMATQFHPEKSGPDGLGFLRRFVATLSTEVTA